MMDVFAVLMEHVVTVYGPQTTTTDAGGGTTITWPTVRQANVPCLIKDTMNVVKDQFGQDMLVGQDVIAMFYTGCRRGDRLTVTAGPTFVGLNLKVSGIQSQPRVEFLGFTEDINHVQVEAVG